MFPTPAPLILRGQRFDASRPAVMGIINRTADSFYGPARHADAEAAVERAQQMVEEGVDIIDVGGVRAGQKGDWVTEAEEIERVKPVLEALRELPVLVSLDTWRAEVAQPRAKRHCASPAWQQRRVGRVTCARSPATRRNVPAR